MSREPRPGGAFSWLAHNQSMNNVDAQELAKFSDLAHRWWDTESEFRPRNASYLLVFSLLKN